MTKALRLPCLSSACLALLFAAGCNSSHIASSIPSITGNWTFTTQTSVAGSPALTLKTGITEQPNGSVTAIAHLSGASCVSSGTPISFTGSVDEFGNLKLVSKTFNGNVLTVKGQVAALAKTSSKMSITFTGGSCSSLGVMVAAGTQYTQINGNYAGTFVDVNSNQLAVNATLTQTTQPDSNGQFHLSGSATFPNNPCFTQPLVTDSLVTGSDLSTTYAQNGATITAVGTFNSDATQLTITQWNVSGGLCDGDSGTGLLTEQVQ